MFKKLLRITIEIKKSPKVLKKKKGKLFIFKRKKTKKRSKD